MFGGDWRDLRRWRGCQSAGEGLLGGLKCSPVYSATIKDNLEVVEYTPPPVLTVVVQRRGREDRCASAKPKGTPDRRTEWPE